MARGLGIGPNAIELVRQKLLNTLKLPWKSLFMRAHRALQPRMVQVGSLRCYFFPNPCFPNACMQHDAGIKQLMNMQPKLQRWLLNKYRGKTAATSTEWSKDGYRALVAAHTGRIEDAQNNRSNPTLSCSSPHACAPRGLFTARLLLFFRFFSQNLMLNGEPGGSRRSRRNCVDSEWSRP